MKINENNSMANSSKIAFGISMGVIVASGALLFKFPGWCDRVGMIYFNISVIAIIANTILQSIVFMNGLYILVNTAKFSNI